MMRAFSRFNPEHLLQPRSIAGVGAESPAGQRVLHNLRDAGFPGRLEAVDGLGEPGFAPELGIVAGDALQPGYAMLAGQGAGVVIGLGPGAWDGGNCRMVGPGAFGVIVPGAGLNASLAHVP